MKALVMQQKHVGDVLASTVIAETLHRHFAGAEVHFLSHAGAAPVLACNPWIQQAHHYAADASAPARLAVARALRRQRFDVLIDAYGKWESLLLVPIVAAGRSIGYRKSYTRPVYDDCVVRTPAARWGMPLSIEHRLRLLEPLTGAHPGKELGTRPRLFVTADERRRAQAFLQSQGVATHRPVWMIAALGSVADKTYPLAAMASLLDHLAQRVDATFLFNFLPAQRAQAAALRGLCQPATRARIPLEAWSPDLRQFVALLSLCQALFGNEGGATNMARALDVPSFSIFAPFVDRDTWADTGDPLWHPAVHLRDSAPELLAGMGARALRARSHSLYAGWRPQSLLPALDAFVATCGARQPAATAATFHRPARAAAAIRVEMRP